MNATAILDRLKSLGVAVWSNGDRLRFKPASRVPGDLRDSMAQAKPELLTLLQVVERQPDDADLIDPLPASTPCPRCGSTDTRDVVLRHDPHDGRSTRRDCGRCGRFVAFVRWYGHDVPLCGRN